jgi:hypothetical protein
VFFVPFMTPTRWSLVFRASSASALVSKKILVLCAQRGMFGCGYAALGAFVFRS